MTKILLEKIETGYSWYNTSDSELETVRQMLEMDPNATQQNRKRTIVDSEHYEVPANVYSEETMKVLRENYPSMFSKGVGRTLQIGACLAGIVGSLYLLDLGLKMYLK